MVVSPSRWNKLKQCWLLEDDRKTRRLANPRPKRPAFRFSARMGRPHGGSQLIQQFVHPAMLLLQGHGTMFALPWAQLDLNQVTEQKQMMMSNADNLTPALKLLWGPQARLIPEQSLFIKAIAMLLAKPQGVAQAQSQL